MKHLKTIIAVLLLVFATGNLVAEADHPWFVGLKLGRTRYCQDFYGPTGSGNIKLYEMRDSAGPGGTLELGREFGRYFALGGSWTEYGSRFRVAPTAGDATMGGILSLGAQGPYRMRIQGWSFAATGFVPLGKRVRLYAKAGTAYWRIRQQVDLPATVITAIGTGVGGVVIPVENPIVQEWPVTTTSGHDLLLAGGVEYAFAARWSARLEYEQTWTRLGTVQGGIYWRF